MGAIALRTATWSTLPLLPILVAQGKRVKRETPRLPGAAGPTSGTVDAPGRALTLLVIGESTAAGVGAPDHEHALTGQTARALAARTGRAVNWTATGQIGADAQRARRLVAEQVAAAPADLVVIALGVNDVLAFHSPRVWVRQLRALVAELRALVGPCPIALAAVPPMGQLPALPQPLRFVLGLRARMLDRAAARLARSLPGVVHVPNVFAIGAELWCEDRFHPSVAGYRAWGETLASALAAAGSPLGH